MICLSVMGAVAFLLTPLGQRCLWQLSGRPCGDPLLFHAIVEGKHSLVNAAFEQGASANARDRQNMTPLMWAADVGDEELVQRLLALGADVTATSDQEMTALALAAGSGHIGIVRRLLDAGAAPDQPVALRGTALHWAATFFQVEAADVLLGRGARVDARDKFGRTPLMLAARHHSGIHVIRQLLAAGADPGAVDDEGLSVLDLAASDNNADLVNLLGREIRWSSADIRGTSR